MDTPGTHRRTGRVIYISEIYLFGSLLSEDRTDVGDIDLIVIPLWRFPEDNTFDKQKERETAMGLARSPRNYLEAIAPMSPREATRRIQRISPRLSVTGPSTLKTPVFPSLG